MLVDGSSIRELVCVFHKLSCRSDDDRKQLTVGLTSCAASPLVTGHFGVHTMPPAVLTSCCRLHILLVLTIYL